MLKCNELFLFAKNQIDVGSHLRAESLLINLLQFNRRGREGLQHPLFQVRVLNLLASCQRHLGKSTHSQETLDIALMICRDYGCPAGETYLTLGALQMDLKEYELAKRSCQECIRLLEPDILETPNKPEARFLATAYYNMGHCCLELGDRGLGVNMYAKSLSILKRTFVSTSNSLFVMVLSAYQEALEMVRRGSLNQDQQTTSEPLNLTMDNNKEGYKPLFAIKAHKQNPMMTLIDRDEEQTQIVNRNPQSLRRVESGVIVGKKTRPQSSNVAKSSKTQHSLKAMCLVGDSDPTVGFVSPNTSQLQFAVRGDQPVAGNHGKSALLAPKRVGNFILQHRRNNTANGVMLVDTANRGTMFGKTGSSPFIHSNSQTEILGRRGRLAPHMQRQPLRIKVKLDTIRTVGIDEAKSGSSKATLRSKERPVIAPSGDISEDESVHMIEETTPVKPEAKTLDLKSNLSFLKAVKHQLVDQPLSKKNKKAVSEEQRDASAKKIQRAWRRYFYSDGRKKYKMKHRSSAARWVMNKFFKIESDLHKQPRKVFPCKVMVYLDRKSTLLDVYVIRRRGGKKSVDTTPNPDPKRRNSTGYSMSEPNGENLLPTLKWIGWVDVDLTENFFGNLTRLRINQKGKPYFSAVQEKMQDSPKGSLTKAETATVEENTLANSSIKPDIPRQVSDPAVSLKIPLILPRKKKPQTPGSSRKNSTKLTQSAPTPPQESTTVTIVTLNPFQIIPNRAPSSKYPRPTTNLLPTSDPDLKPPSDSSFPPIPPNELQNQQDGKDITTPEYGTKIPGSENLASEKSEADLVITTGPLMQTNLETREEHQQPQSGVEAKAQTEAFETKLAHQIEESVLQKVHKLLEEKYNTSSGIKVDDETHVKAVQKKEKDLLVSQPEVAQVVTPPQKEEETLEPPVKQEESNTPVKEPEAVVVPLAEPATKPTQVGKALFGLFKSKIPAVEPVPHELTFADGKSTERQVEDRLVSGSKHETDPQPIPEVPLEGRDNQSLQDSDRSSVQQNRLLFGGSGKSLDIGQHKVATASEKLSATENRLNLADAGSLDSAEAQAKQQNEESGSPASVRTKSVISAFEGQKRMSKSMSIELAAEYIKKFCSQVIERRRSLLAYRILREVRNSEEGMYMIVIYRQEKILSIRVVQLKKKGFYDYLYLKIDDQLQQKMVNPEFFQRNVVVIRGKIKILDDEEEAFNQLYGRPNVDPREQIRDELANQISVLEDSSGSQVSDEEMDEKEHRAKVLELEGKPTPNLTLPKSQFSQLALVPQQTTEDYPPIPIMALTRSKSLARDYLPVIDYADLVQDMHMPTEKIKSGGKDSSNGSKNSNSRQDVLRLKPESHEISFTNSQRRISSPSVFHAPVSKHTALSRDTKQLGLAENLRFRFVCSRSDTAFWIVIKELSKGGIFIVEVENHQQRYIESLVFETELVGLPIDEISMRTPKERAEWLLWKIAPTLSFIPGMGKPAVMLGDDLSKTSHADLLCISGRYF